MSEKEFKLEAFVRCPFCGTSDDFCPDFLGWTEDGETVYTWPNFLKVALRVDRHIVYKIKGGFRVYSKNVGADLIEAGAIAITRE